MAENNNIVIRELNPTKKEEGDIFFHNEYNDIVDVVKNHKDVLRKVFDKNFPFTANIKVNREFIEPYEKVNLKFDWEYDRDLTDQYVGGLFNPVQQVSVNLRTKTFNNIIGADDNLDTFILSLNAISNDLKLYLNYYIESISPLYLTSSNKDKLLSSDVIDLQFYNTEEKDIYIRKYKNPLVFSNSDESSIPKPEKNENQTFEYNVDCTEGRYVYILVPDYINVSEMYVGGLKNTAWEVGEMNVENIHGTLISYNVYRSTYKFHSLIPIKMIVTNNSVER